MNVRLQNRWVHRWPNLWVWFQFLGMGVYFLLITPFWNRCFVSLFWPLLWVGAHSLVNLYQNTCQYQGDIVYELICLIIRLGVYYLEWPIFFSVAIMCNFICKWFKQYTFCECVVSSFASWLLYRVRNQLMLK